jgi:hypothetical protein
MKSIILVRGERSEQYNTFKNRILTFANELARMAPKAAVSVTLTEGSPPGLSVIPFKKRKIAAISIFGNNQGMIELHPLPEGFSGIYRVTEALPVSYSKDWPDSKRTPGACLLTLFRKKKSIDYETFIDRWHNSHTPLSLQIHPLWHYNRNVVDERSASATEVWDGIVEEHIRERRQLTNPFVFFGNPLTMWRNMIRVYTDTNSFLDYRTIETYLAQEYWIHSV